MHVSIIKRMNDAHFHSFLTAYEEKDENFSPKVSPLPSINFQGFS
ncbi:hypothetical protein ES332_D06G183500v1 [Gossypium tomentosum]|uniref:Uncharacterized protein n=1 Tax=Gossypium tomentosum TaxID=34277 RepID=A0A5D2KJN2_GOSTO|nr:hypothetical protein ES332_D06G183500v1 [Gossypium tomentosum]